MKKLLLFVALLAALQLSGQQAPFLGSIIRTETCFIIGDFNPENPLHACWSMKESAIPELAFKTVVLARYVMEPSKNTRCRRYSRTLFWQCDHEQAFACMKWGRALVSIEVTNTPYKDVLTFEIRKSAVRKPLIITDENLNGNVRYLLPRWAYKHAIDDYCEKNHVSKGALSEGEEQLICDTQASLMQLLLLRRALQEYDRNNQHRGGAL